MLEYVKNLQKINSDIVGGVDENLVVVSKATWFWIAGHVVRKFWDFWANILRIWFFLLGLYGSKIENVSQRFLTDWIFWILIRSSIGIHRWSVRKIREKFRILRTVFKMCNGNEKILVVKTSKFFKQIFPKIYDKIFEFSTLRINYAILNFTPEIRRHCETSATERTDPTESSINHLPSKKGEKKRVKSTPPKKKVEKSDIRPETSNVE